MADLYSFTLQGGGVYRYSGGASAIVDPVSGRTFTLGPKFERSRIRLVLGVEVDELDVKIYPEPTDLLGSTPWLQAAWLGQLDGALLELERAFMQTPTSGSAAGYMVIGTVVLFAGRVSDIDASRTGLNLKCRSHLELLNIQMPRRLWQASCTHIFGDAMCQFDRTSLATDFACADGSSATVILGAPATAVPYTQGSIFGLSGANSGETRTIAEFASGQSVTVKLAFLNAPLAGDTFRLLPGCDHSLATCTNIFANQVHFGGMPFIPAPENAV